VKTGVFERGSLQNLEAIKYEGSARGGAARGRVTALTATQYESSTAVFMDLVLADYPVNSHFTEDLSLTESCEL